VESKEYTRDKLKRKPINVDETDHCGHKNFFVSDSTSDSIVGKSRDR